MAKQRDAQKARDEMTEREFNALVDEGFADHRQSKLGHGRGGIKPWCPPDELIDKLEEEGADPRLTRGAARLHGALARCFGSPKPGQPLSDESVKFLNEFHAAASAAAKADGIKLRDD